MMLIFFILALATANNVSWHYPDKSQSSSVFDSSNTVVMNSFASYFYSKMYNASEYYSSSTLLLNASITNILFSNSSTTLSPNISKTIFSNSSTTLSPNISKTIFSNSSITSLLSDSSSMFTNSSSTLLINTSTATNRIISPFMFLANYIYKSKCSNSDEVVKDVFFGYIRGTKTSDNQNKANNALNSFKDWSYLSTRQSFKYSYGNIAGYMWIGSMVQNSGFIDNAFQIMYDEVKNSGIPKMIYIEYVNGNPMQGFGVVIDTTGNISRTQKAVKNWSAGKSFNEYEGNKIYGSKSACYLSYANRKGEANDNEAGKCLTFKAESGKPISDLTSTPGEYLKVYNPGIDFSKVMPGQTLCYSEGTAPDLRPQKPSDGKCYVYDIQSGDSCSSIAAKYSPLSVDDIKKYNSKTYGWGSCNNLLKDGKICLTDGTPPKPKSDPNAECGPFAPGDKYLKECPNKACCSKWGYCGLTSEFCENECFSNCGYGSMPSRHASSFNSVAFWMDETGPMYYDVNSISSEYNIVHYSFADFDSNSRTITTKSGFEKFLGIPQKKVVSFGGWDFSTSPSSYFQFRNLVNSDLNSAADMFVNFMDKYNLDGINFDWEYPGAPDIPGIPAGKEDEGEKYNKLIKAIKNKRPSKLVSVCLPASYWYLKGFPLAEIDKNIDYYVLMNYDYVGQWDYGKRNTGLGCHVNQETTVESIKMIVKSGIDTTKLYGGTGNYGRSFHLSNTNCINYLCGFTGPQSGAKAGDVTKTPGFLAISEIKSMGMTNQKFDYNTKCFSAQYNGGQDWVAWMENSDINFLRNDFKNWGLGGTALWAINYEVSSGENNKDMDDICENQDTDEYLGTGDPPKYATILSSDDETCNIPDYTVDIETESNTQCLLNGIIFDILETTYGNPAFIKNIDKKKFSKQHKALVKAMSNVIMLTLKELLRSNKNYDYIYFNCEGKTVSSCYTVSMIGTIEQHIRSYMYRDLVIKEDKKDDLRKEIEESTGLKVDNEDIKRMEKNIGGSPSLEINNVEYFDYASKMPNPLDNIDEEYLNNLEELYKSILNEKASIELYYMSLPLLQFREVTDQVQLIADEGQKILDQERKKRILSIISYLFAGLSVLAMPFGLTIGIAVDIASIIATTVAEAKLYGTVDGADIGIGLFGIVAPFVKFKGLRLTEIFKKIDTDDFKKLNGKIKYAQKYENLMKNKWC